MKLFISADIEGVAGISQWNETEQGPWYDYFCQEMSSEVAAACEGAIQAGVENIFVKDGHHTACNILPHLLPKEAVLNRGWSGDGFGMMSGIQNNVDVVAMVGYHSASFSDQNPLSHTSENYIRNFEINGKRASEFMINRYTCAMLGIPVVFVSGDEGICEEVRQTDKKIETFATLQGWGDSTIGLHPEVAQNGIFQGMKQAIQAKNYQVPNLPQTFDIRITYQERNRARKASLYPGAKLLDPYTVQFETREYFDFLRFYSFVG